MTETSHITPDRSHSLSGRKNLDWFFANRKWVRTAGNSVVEAAWAKRELPAGESGIRFLFLAAKRSYKRAHDRNQIKRWLRAAITEAADFAEIEDFMTARNQQILVMLRISKPIAELQWDSILNEVNLIAEHIKNRNLASNQSMKSTNGEGGQPLVLIKKADKKIEEIART